MILIDRNIRKGAPCSAASGQDLKTSSKTAAYDNYYSRLVKLIPSEIIALYLALDGIASTMKNKEAMLWLAFSNTLVLAWIYLGQMANVTQFSQRFLTILGLVLWVYVFGGPFAGLSWYDASYGKFLLVVYTFFTPMLFKGKLSDT